MRFPRAWILLSLLLLIAVIAASPRAFAPAPPVSRTNQATEPRPASLSEMHADESAVANGEAPAAVDTLMPALSVDTRGQRTSLQVRQSYAQRLRTEAELAAFARELTALATSGDGAAAAALSKLYSGCAGEIEYTGPGVRRCTGFGELLPALAARLRAASNAWQQIASRLGDPASVLRPGYFGSRMSGVAADAEELRLRAAAAELLADGDHEALLDASFMLSGLSDRYDSQAFEWALCSVRPACPGAPPRCQSVNRCNRYERSPTPRFDQLTPRQARIIAGQQAEIVRALQQGDYEALWRPLDPGDGG
jgi:hypothetical protein